MATLLSTRGLRILVVDDEPDLQRNVEKTLEEEGYVVETAANGTEALHKLQQRSFDLIILDVIMPDPLTGRLSKRAGMDLLKQIRSQGLNTPVVLLSANEDIGLVSEATLDHAKYLVKGYVSPQKFIKTIQETIGEDSEPSKELEKKAITPKRWLVNRFVSILDEVVTGVIVTGIMYFFGKATGILEGKPLDWLSNATIYLVISILVIVLTIMIYIFWRRRSR